MTDHVALVIDAKAQLGEGPLHAPSAGGAPAVSGPIGGPGSGTRQLRERIL